MQSRLSSERKSTAFVDNLIYSNANKICTPKWRGDERIEEGATARTTCKHKGGHFENEDCSGWERIPRWLLWVSDGLFYLFSANDHQTYRTFRMWIMWFIWIDGMVHGHICLPWNGWEYKVMAWFMHPSSRQKDRHNGQTLGWRLGYHVASGDTKTILWCRYCLELYYE